MIDLTGKNIDLKVNIAPVNKNDSLLKTIAKGGMIIFLGAIIGKIFRFVFSICLMRVLGASLYGLYSIGQSIIDIVTNVGLLGDGRGFIRFAASFHHDGDIPRLKGMIKAYTLICLLLSVIISIVLFLGAERISSQLFHNLALTGVLRIFAISFPFYIFSLIVIPVGYALQRMQYKVIVQEITQPVINITAVAVIFVLGGRLYGAVAGFFISSVFAAGLGFYFLRKIYLENAPGQKSILEIKKLITYSLPLMGIILCYYLFFRLDRIMLGIYRTPFEVGIYSAASNTAVGILAFSSIFDSAFTPIITQLYHSNQKEELSKIYNCVTSWGVYMTFIPCILVIIFNKEIISLFGKNLSPAEPALAILSIAFLMEMIPGQLRQLFQMTSHQNLELINSILMVAFIFILNLILIPSLGVIGAALSFLLTIVIISLIRILELRVIFGFSPFDGRYLKFTGYIIFAIIISLLSLAYPSIILKSVVALFILLLFMLLVFKFRCKEDMVVWNSLKAKLTGYGFSVGINEDYE